MHLLAFAEGIQLFPDGTLFIHVALILVMIWVLNRTLYRPINKIIEAREKSKGGHSGEAAGILKNVDEKQAHYRSELLDTRSKGYELVENEQKAAAAVRDKEIADAKKEAARKFEQGKAALEKQSAEVHAAIKSDAEKLAESITANILKG